MNVRDDSEIDWKLLGDEDWNLWSAHLLQRQWRKLTLTIKGYEEMAFQGSPHTILFFDGLNSQANIADLIDVLKQKCTLPQASATAPHLERKPAKRPPNSLKKRPKSAAIIEDDKWDEAER
jgi:hypothetical protein